jgi:hypothetical protein
MTDREVSMTYVELRRLIEWMDAIDPIPSHVTLTEERCNGIGSSVKATVATGDNEGPWKLLTDVGDW